MSAKSSAILAVGRRKTASARIRLSRGTGVIVVNGKPVEEYLYTEALVKSATLPITTAGLDGQLDVIVRVLARHPRVKLAAVCSRTLAGKSVAEEIPRLRGVVDPALVFAASSPEECAKSDVDVWFLALPHGVAAEYAAPLVAAGKRVLDLSADFRLRDLALYKKYYGHDHPAPALAAKARYVIPELQADGAWKSAKLIACPGCYPTSIQAVSYTHLTLPTILRV